MSKPRKANKLTMPALSGQTKILFASHPGKTGAVLVNGKLGSTIKFKDAHAALDWAIQERAAFFYTPQEDVSKN